MKLRSSISPHFLSFNLLLIFLYSFLLSCGQPVYFSSYPCSPYKQLLFQCWRHRIGMRAWVVSTTPTLKTTIIFQARFYQNVIGYRECLTEKLTKILLLPVKRASTFMELVTNSAKCKKREGLYVRT